LLALGLAAPLGAAAQDPPADEGADERASAAEKYRELTEPERMLEKRKKALEKQKPPFEFFRSQVLPFDVLPYAKAGHWNTMTLDLRANLADYDGVLRSAPVRLLGMPHEMVYVRDARLVQEQQARLAFQIMLPDVVKELTLELTHADALRGEGAWQASLRRIEPHQMLVPVLSAEAAAYTPWSRFHALVPSSGDKDAAAMDVQRYYRLVQSLTPDKPPPLSTHPLTWTTTSHILWDGMLPEMLNTGQQQALLDWLHWGGQLILIGGAGPSLTAFRDSFLAPYLPASLTGSNTVLTREDLAPLEQAYLAPKWPGEWEQEIEGHPQLSGRPPDRYQNPTDKPSRILPAPGKGIFLTGLKPADAAAVPLYLSKDSGHILAVERRVGRGRIMILGFKPTDPVLLAWPGLDTLVRRIVFRRPLENWNGQAYSMLSGRQLSWVRYLARDLGAAAASEATPDQGRGVANEVTPNRDPVAAWIDSATLPVRARQELEKASGLTIPGADFVLKVILAYVVALVPLNWIICRFAFRRRELAWVIAPILALGFAIVVERGAAYDLGFESACDEVDLLEIQGDYPRGHLSRFAAIYSSARARFSIAYPDDPTALALPLNMGHSLRGDEVLQSTWQSSPEPALENFPVQPRSLAMFRAEQLINMPGGITLESSGTTRRVVNRSGLELRDAMVVEVGTGRRYRLGTIAPNASFVLGAPEPPPPKKDEKDDTKKKDPDWLVASRDRLQPGEPFLDLLRDYTWPGPEDRGEIRLVAWTAKPHGGQKLQPVVDRHRGFRLVVAHLQFGTPPSPSEGVYAGVSPQPASPSYAMDRLPTDQLGAVPPLTAVADVRVAGQARDKVRP
jgi:hypothetical protein